MMAKTTSRPKQKPRRRKKHQTRAITRDTIIRMFGLDADVSAAGVNVGVSDAYGLSAFYNAIRVISEDIGKLPLVLYSELDNDARKKAKSNPLYRLLRYSPNPEMSAATFRETLTQHALVWGNGYAEIEMNGNGFPVATWPLAPTDVSVGRDSEGLKYKVQPPGQPAVMLLPEQVLHIHGLGFDGILGYGLYLLAKDSLGAAIATQRYAASFYKNGASLSGVLETPNSLKTEAYNRLRESWAERHEGAGKAHKPAILEQGVKWTPLGVNPEQSQQIQTREFSVEDVCRWARIQPHKVGHLARAAGWSTLEATNMDHLTDCLLPWCVRWEQEYQRKIIRADNLYCEHLYEQMLRPDTATRYAAYGMATGNKPWMKRNEVRIRENMEPVEGWDEEDSQPPQPTLQVTPEDEEITRNRLAGEIRSLIHSEQDKRSRGKFNYEQHIAEVTNRVMRAFGYNGERNANYRSNN